MSDVINGTNVRVYAAGAPIAYATACTLDLQVEFIELAPTTLNNAEWRRVRPRKAAGTVSVSALFSEDAANEEFDSLFTDLDNQSSLLLEVRGQGLKYTGSAYVQAMSLNASVGQSASWSVTFVFTGDVTKEITA